MRRSFILIQFFVFAIIVFGQAQEKNQTDSKGRKQGVWMKMHEGTKNKRYVGTFKDDKPVGKFTYYYQTGEVSAVTEFQNDDKTAYTRMYHVNGKVMAAGKYVNQKKDSIWLYFNDRKEILSKENYENGKLNGQVIVYYPSDPSKGNIKRYEITNYVDGIRNGEWIQFFNSGKTKAEGVYKDGNYEGVVKWYHTNGKMEIRGFYKHAVQHGFWKYYEKDGTLKRKVYYRYGEVLEGAELEKYLDKLRKEKTEQNK